MKLINQILIIVAHLYVQLKLLPFLIVFTNSKILILKVHLCDFFFQIIFSTLLVVAISVDSQFTHLGMATFSTEIDFSD
jgi:fucose permease